MSRTRLRYARAAVLGTLVLAIASGCSGTVLLMFGLSLGVVRWTLVGGTAVVCATVVSLLALGVLGRLDEYP